MTADNKGVVEVTGGLKDMKASGRRDAACWARIFGALRPASCCLCCLRCPSLPHTPQPASFCLLFHQVLKTTQSGYSGFAHDRFTTLPDVADRIVATSVTATWRCVFWHCAHACSGLHRAPHCMRP